MLKLVSGFEQSCQGKPGLSSTADRAASMCKLMLLFLLKMNQIDDNEENVPCSSVHICQPLIMETTLRVFAFNSSEF